MEFTASGCVDKDENHSDDLKEELENKSIEDY